MANVYVYSTLSASNRYTKYARGGNDIPREERSVLIKGGANVADKHLITPRGVVTEISAEDYEFLKDNVQFRKHVENGYITVEEREASIEKVVTNMEPRDESAPLVPEDYTAHDQNAPVTNAAAPAKAPAAPGARRTRKRR
jgi:hypothetical protein